MLLLIDNFDSFSHILADLIRQTGVVLEVVRNDISLYALEQMNFEGLILSPGPGRPSEAGNLMQILEKYHLSKPILGVCLGHQAIGEFFGASLITNPIPTHGKVRQVIKSTPHEYTQSVPNQFRVTRYHSLQLANLPSELISILESESGEIMGIAHYRLPILGIQYHPEAYLTEYGLEIVRDWVIAFELKASISG
jgi:anthranilate synthase component 2